MNTKNMADWDNPENSFNSFANTNSTGKKLNSINFDDDSELTRFLDFIHRRKYHQDYQRLLTSFLPEGLSVDRLMVFLFDKWEAIADFAYSCYLKSSRGLTLFLHKETASDDNFYYIPVDDLISRNFPEDLIEGVKQYDPEKFIVIAVMSSQLSADLFSNNQNRKPIFWLTFNFDLNKKLAPKIVYLQNRN